MLAVDGLPIDLVFGIDCGNPDHPLLCRRKLRWSSGAAIADGGDHCNPLRHQRVERFGNQRILLAGYTHIEDVDVALR